MESNVKTEAKHIHIGGIYRHPKYKLILIVGCWTTIGEEAHYFRFKQIIKKGTKYVIGKEVLGDYHKIVWWKAPDVKLVMKVVENKEEQ